MGRNAGGEKDIDPRGKRAKIQEETDRNLWEKRKKFRGKTGRNSRGNGWKCSFVQFTKIFPFRSFPREKQTEV